MANVIMPVVILSGMIFVFVRLSKRLAPLSARATALLMIYGNVVIFTSNWMARITTNTTMLLTSYGFEAVGSGIHVVKDTRTELIISNGDHFSLAALHFWQFVGLLVWGGLLFLIFVATRFTLKRLLRGLYLEFSNYFAAFKDGKRPNS